MTFETSARVVVGIPVTAGDFWATSGAVPYCPRCGIDRTDRHCSLCGALLEYRQVREPLDPLRALGHRWGIEDPEKSWVRLHEGQDPVRFHAIDAVIDYRMQEGRLALGKIVVQSPPMPLIPTGKPSGTRSFDPDELARAVDEVSRFAREIGLFEPPQTYLVLENKIL